RSARGWGPSASERETRYETGSVRCAGVLDCVARLRAARAIQRRGNDLRTRASERQGCRSSEEVVDGDLRRDICSEGAAAGHQAAEHADRLSSEAADRPI